MAGFAATPWTSLKSIKPSLKPGSNYPAMSGSRSPLDRYFFFHIPKTAGTSLFHVFREVLGAENVGPVIGPRTAFDQLNLERMRKYQMLGGHVYFELLRHLGTRRLLTILRSPVDHLLSKYYFFRNVAGVTRDPAVQMAKDFTMEQLLDGGKGDTGKFFFNPATWFLAGLGDRSHLVSERIAVERAKENLATFDFVGLYEEMADSLDLMSYTLSWPAVRRMPRENVTPGRVNVEQLDPAIRRRLEAASQLDAELYDFGRELFFSRKRAMMAYAVRMNRAEHPPAQGREAARDSANSSTPTDRTPVIREPGIKVGQVLVTGDLSGNSNIQSGELCGIRLVLVANRSVTNADVLLFIRNRFHQTLFRCSLADHGLLLDGEPGVAQALTFRMRMTLGEEEYVVGVHVLEQVATGYKEACDVLNDAARFRIWGFTGVPFGGIVDLSPTITRSEGNEFDGIPVCRLGTAIDFSRHGDGHLYAFSGWSAPEDWGCWSMQAEAQLVMRLPCIPDSGLTIKAHFHGYCPAGLAMSVELHVNGRKRQQWDLQDETQREISLTLAAHELLNPLLLMLFRISAPRSPASLGLSSDTRQLGIGFECLELTEAGLNTAFRSVKI